MIQHLYYPARRAGEHCARSLRLARAVLARARTWVPVIVAALAFAAVARADELPEYRLKAAFMYNFMVYTEWPSELGPKINLCILGQDPFGAEIDALADKPIGRRSIVVQRLAGRKGLADCQVLYIAPSAIGGLASVLEAVSGKPVLTVADSPNAARDGAAINMALRDSKVSFEVNLKAVHAAHLSLSSKLLRLAKEVLQ